MKKIVKISLNFVIVSILFLVCLNMTYAVEKYYSPFIPVKLSNVQKIEFIDDNYFIVLEGNLDKNYKFEYMDDESLSELYPSPSKGMIVTYGEDGQVNKIMDQNGNDIDGIAQNDNGISTYSIDDKNNNVLKAKWGSAPNKLYWNTHYKCYYGYGRATAFGDKVGQKDHVLKKGDVATSLKYDNITCGTTVTVTAKNTSTKKNVTKSMTKWDAGGMPNAIVDIWKDGVSYWGGNPKKINTFSRDNVVIKHGK